MSPASGPVVLPTMSRLVLATRNTHKVEEIRRILAAEPVPVELLSLAEFPAVGEVAETGLTFAENALLKARAVADATGLPAVADDSGLAVEALNGMPGVFSSRWSGRPGDDEENLRLLLAQLRDVGQAHRRASFVCVAALVVPGDGEIVEEGRVVGQLTREPRGTHGFGYDPIFVPDGQTRTTAQMSPEEKDAISHRGRAFRRLARHLARGASSVT